jgi:hypothetical protein
MTDRHTCAVCDTPIGPSFLMCAGHWHMVPRELKQRVYRAWAALQRHGGVERANLPHLSAVYQAAREEAVLVVARNVAGEEPLA